MRKNSLLSGVYAGVLILLLSSGVAADIALVTHPSNPLNTLEVTDAKRLFLKQSREFPDGNHVEVAMLSKQSEVLEDSGIRLASKLQGPR